MSYCGDIEALSDLLCERCDERLDASAVLHMEDPDGPRQYRQWSRTCDECRPAPVQRGIEAFFARGVS